MVLNLLSDLQLAFHSSRLFSQYSFYFSFISMKWLLFLYLLLFFLWLNSSKLFRLTNRHWNTLYLNCWKLCHSSFSFSLRSIFFFVIQVKRNDLVSTLFTYLPLISYLWDDWKWKNFLSSNYLYKSSSQMCECWAKNRKFNTYVSISCVNESTAELIDNNFSKIDGCVFCSKYVRLLSQFI